MTRCVYVAANRCIQTIGASLSINFQPRSSPNYWQRKETLELCIDITLAPLPHATFIYHSLISSTIGPIILNDSPLTELFSFLWIINAVWPLHTFVEEPFPLNMLNMYVCIYQQDIMIVFICPKTKSFIFSLQLKSMFTRARKVQCIDPRPVSISETGRSFDDSLRCPLRPSLSIPPSLPDHCTRHNAWTRWTQLKKKKW